MADPQLSVKVTLDNTDVVKGLKDLNRKFKRSAAEINATLEIFKKAFDAVATVIDKLTSAMIENAKLAAEQQRAEIRVAAALQKRGKFTQQNFEELQKFNKELQRMLGFADEELLLMQGSLASMGIRNKQMQDATRFTIGLADATGKTLKEAAITVGKVMGGDIGLLREYGITVSSVSEAQKKMADLFDIAKEQANTYGVRVKVLSSNWGDYREELGKAIIESKTINGAIDAINDLLVETINLMGGAKGKEAMETFFRAMALALADLIDAWEGLKKIVADTMALGGGRVGAAFGVAGSLSPVKFLADWRSAVKDLKSELSDLVHGVDTSGDDGGQSLASQFADKLRALAVDKSGVKVKRTGRVKKDDDGGGGGSDPFANDLKAAQDKAIELANKFAREMDIAKIKGQTAAADAANDETKRKAKATIELVHGMASSIGSAFGSMFEAIGSGSMNVLQALGQMLAGILRMLGQMLIQFGTAALATRLLYLIPALAPFAGEPTTSTAAAVGLLAAGATVMLAAGAMGAASGGGGGGGGGGGSGASGSSRLRQVRGTGPRSPLNRGGFRNPGFFEDPTRGDPNAEAGTTININFGRAALVGTKREVGSFIADVLREYQGLTFGGRAA